MSRGKRHNKKQMIVYVSESFFHLINAYYKSINTELAKKTTIGRIRRNDLIVEALQDWCEKKGLKCRVDYREVEENEKV